MTAIRVLVLWVVAAVMAGCVSTGVDVSEDQYRTLVKGKSTADEVQAMFGPPTSRTVATDGTQTWMYLYVRSQARAANFIPIVGAFVGGADTRSRTVMLTFGADGVLKESTYSESSSGLDTGVGAGYENMDRPKAGSTSSP